MKIYLLFILAFTSCHQPSEEAVNISKKIEENDNVLKNKHQRPDGIYYFDDGQVRCYVSYRALSCVMVRGRNE